MEERDLEWLDERFVESVGEEVEETGNCAVVDRRRMGRLKIWTTARGSAKA